MCEHKNLRTVGDRLFCKDCKEELPIEFLTHGEPVAEEPVAEEPAQEAPQEDGEQGQTPADDVQTDKPAPKSAKAKPARKTAKKKGEE